MADYSFPYGQSLELLLSCFTGTIASKVNDLQQQLQKTDIAAYSGNERYVKTLNSLESQAWLYEGILDRLGSAPSVDQEKVAKTLEALEFKRSAILDELEPLRPRRYQVLAEIQDSARDFLASQAEKDYEKLESIVNNLVLFTINRQPSQSILSEVINELTSEIVQKSNQISPYRLRLAYKIDGLMNAISSRLILEPTDFKTTSVRDKDSDKKEGQVR